MLTIVKNDIYLTRGDSAVIEIAVHEADGAPHIKESGEYARIHVRRSAGDALAFVGNVSLDDGAVTWTISPSDTKPLKGTSFVYDVEIVNGDDVFTIIPESKFILKEEVTV